MRFRERFLSDSVEEYNLTIMMEKVTIAWTHGTDFELRDQTCDRLNPKALLLYALARCAGMTAAAIFQKMEIEPESFEIICRGELSTPTLMAESVFVSLDMNYNVKCRRLKDQVRVSHALDLTHEKYCGLVKMMRKVAPLSHEIYIHSSETVGQQA